MKKKKKNDKVQTNTKAVKLIDKKITDILPYLFDENFVSCGEWFPTGDRRFTTRVILKKKTKK